MTEGEKLRLGGRLLLEAFAPSVGASTRALLLKLPTLFRAESAADYYPRSLVLSYGELLLFSDEEPITTLHYRGSVKMLPIDQTLRFSAGRRS